MMIDIQSFKLLARDQFLFLEIFFFWLNEKTLYIIFHGHQFLEFNSKIKLGDQLI